MAFISGKGSIYKKEVSTVLTTIGQLISIDLPEHEIETFEADTLDNANDGIPYKPTGRVEGGSIGLEGFLDPVLASFQILTDWINAPATPEGGSITFADTASTAWTFEQAGITLGGSIALNDGVKFTATIKLDGAIESFPT